MRAEPPRLAGPAVGDAQNSALQNSALSETIVAGRTAIPENTRRLHSEEATS
jgi:hypothetical protein